MKEGENILYFWTLWRKFSLVRLVHSVQNSKLLHMRPKAKTERMFRLVVLFVSPSMLYVDTGNDGQMLVSKVFVHSACYITISWSDINNACFITQAGPTVRHKCLQTLLRMIYYAEPTLLKEILQSQPVSRY